MDRKTAYYHRPGFFSYTLARVLSFIVSAFVFRRRFIRNELKGVKGSCVVIANHEAALDFVNLIGASPRRMTFVISNSFYSSLPVKGIMDKMGVIPKQQFQTTATDMKKMKAVVDSGEILVIYPAGLMCEDGLSTPIPAATWKFLKWLKADVYMARTKGSYFVMPKWTKGFRPGRTYMDVYKLFDKEELASMDPARIKDRAEATLLFDAYREQEELKISYSHNDDIRGLENVLYLCPRCHREFTMEIKDGGSIRCRECGYEETADSLGFFHAAEGSAPELRYVSDWSRLEQQSVREMLEKAPDQSLSSPTAIHMIDPTRNKFTEVGRGKVTLSRAGFLLEGQIRGESISLFISTANIPTLPFSPGKRIELQDGPTIYRCVLDDGKLAIKFIHMLKAFYELNAKENLR